MATAQIQKVSSNKFQTQNPPAPQNTSVIAFTNDALNGDPGVTTRIGGIAGFSSGATINADSLYLECPQGGTHIGLYHVAITVNTDSNGNSSFDYTTISGLDQTALATLSPPITAQEYWCALYMTESTGRQWIYPSSIRLDKMNPRVDGGRLRTYPLLAMAGGQDKWTWTYNDPGTPLDPDGLNGSSCPACGGTEDCRWQCNKSSSIWRMQSIRRKLPANYDPQGGYAVSAGGEETSMTDLIPDVNQNRIKQNPDIYCYIMRVIDTAGNYSVVSQNYNTDVPTKASEKCIIPDDKPVVFDKVEFYTKFDPVTGFSGKFPSNDYGQPLITSNACHFDPINCAQGSQIVRLRIVASEPLFDAQNRLGANVIMGDNFDNDHGWPPVDVDEEPGGFNNLDDDPTPDGIIDDDVASTLTQYLPYVNDDHADNNANGYVDEIPNSPANADGTVNSCPAKNFWNFNQKTCIGRPRIEISGADTEAAVPGMANPNDALTFLCTQDGITTNPACADLTYGQTAYEFNWDISGPLAPVGIEEDQYRVFLSAADGVGNLTTHAAPIIGAIAVVDNTGPVTMVKYFKNGNFNQTFTVGNHDNNIATPNMPIVNAGAVYVEITADEKLGATPSIYFFLPNAASPRYEGVPQPDAPLTVPLYQGCNQNLACDYCTGLNCAGFDSVTTPCSVFRACFDVTTATNNGYAAVTTLAMDRLSNQAWNIDNAHAIADQHDADKLSDDKYPAGAGDGKPSYVLPIYGTAEPDTAIAEGQFFAIDTYLPATPSISLPIAPCDGIIARAEMSCLNTALTVKNPTLSWTTLNNGIDDDNPGGTGTSCISELLCGGTDVDGDGCMDCVDEECLNGIDDDSDGMIDEDGKICLGEGTAGWEIAQWKLQVATSPTFSPESIVAEPIVASNVKQLANLPERALTSPYYWRVAPYDMAGNMGPYNPDSTGYFTFGIDTLPPAITVNYYLDQNCTVPMPTGPDGTPITGDTAMDPSKIVCLKITTNEPPAADGMPVFETWQLGRKVEGPFAVSAWSPPSATVFKATFEVAAKGAAQKYLDGEVQLKFNAKDLYGNQMVGGDPVSGAKFIVDAVAPEINCSAEPALASMDRNQNGIPGELEGDAIDVNCHVTKYIGDSFRVRVKQNHFIIAPAALNDGIDNDCDGKIDEELLDGLDDDVDGMIDEDTGTTGQKPGSGCWVQLDYTETSSYDYSGKYNVVGTNYDGTATITAGDTNPASRFYLTDLAGNGMLVTTTFEVDTIPPSPAALVVPAHNATLNNSKPQIGWRLDSRAPDLYQYRVEVATSAAFIDLAADKVVNDDGYSTSFFSSIQGDDINIDCGTPLQHCDHLTDNKYYWRVYSYDRAYNRSDSSLVYTFYIETATPSIPIFTSVTTPTQSPSTALSGSTNPPEPNANVNIFVNGQYVGTVLANSSGQFQVKIDYDGDGFLGEDPIDNVDNDMDGLIDENPDGIFLTEGQNIIEGQVIDKAGNVGNSGCVSTPPLYNAVKQQCIVTRDSGPPQFSITYYRDAAFTQALPIADAATGKQAAPAGTVYMRISASKELSQGGAPNPPTFTVDFQGSQDVGVTQAASIGGSLTEFIGSFDVNSESPPSSFDGDAKIIVRGIDSQGNQTPANQLPNHGAYLAVDTQNPTFIVSYWSDSSLMTPIGPGKLLLPVTKERSIYLKIEANQPLREAPHVSVNPAGSADMIDALATSVNNSKSNFKVKYDAHQADGSSYVDGLALVTVTGADIVGNLATDATPSGGSFVIDTTPPQPPTLVLPEPETYFTTSSGSGSVVDASGLAEAQAKVEVFARINLGTTSPDDALDNDGDGRTDEEPNDSDGIDSDHDGFIDEDTTSQTCGANQIWSFNSSACINVPLTPAVPDGTATTNASGGYTVNISGIVSGVNYIYARATDEAGNISAFSAPAVLIARIGEVITLSHEYMTGWNLVGIPLQPNSASPATALQLDNVEFFQLKNGVYVYNAGLDRAAPGVCYWAYFPENMTAVAHGINSTTNTVALSPGWNLAALPYTKSVPWNNTVNVQSYGNTYTIGSEEANEFVESSIYLYNGTTPPYGYVGPKDINAGVMLEPWVGFLIRAKKACSLVFPSQYQVNP